MRKTAWLFPVVALIIGCTGEGDNCFPIAVGNEWHFHETNTYYGPWIEVTTYSTAWVITGTETLDNGADVFVMIVTKKRTSYPSGEVFTYPPLYIEDTDDHILVYDSLADTIPDTLLALPLDLGQTWGNNEVTDQLDITVPAGTFSDCWEIVAGGVFHSYWKSGIGMIKDDWTLIDNNDTTSTHLMELVYYDVD